MAAISLVKNIFHKYPISRGMLMYSITWPTANLVQQTLNGKNWDSYNWKEALRFSIFGSLYVAPTLHGWIRLTSLMLPNTSLKTALIKTALEQISYGPFSIVSFLYIINLMEGKNSEECISEVKRKFIPTWKTGIFVWPVIQTVNYSLIAEKNRVVFVSFCSFMWIIFLAYVKQLQEEKVN